MTRTRRRLVLFALAVHVLVVAPVPAAGADTGTPDLPDLQMAEPRDPYIVVEPEGRHLLRFATAIANVGTGSLFIRYDTESLLAWQHLLDSDGNILETREVGSITLDPEHGHYHLTDVTIYQLRTGSPDGPIVATTPKLSLCFFDQKHLPNWPHASTRTFGFDDCYSGRFGLSPGWIDEYPSFLPNQWVDITGVADGDYHLVQSVNVANGGRIAESTPANNINSVPVQLFNGGQNVRVRR